MARKVRRNNLLGLEGVYPQFKHGVAYVTAHMEGKREKFFRVFPGQEQVALTRALEARALLLAEDVPGWDVDEVVRRLCEYVSRKYMPEPAVDTLSLNREVNLCDDNKFQLIVCDPPWQYKKTAGQGIARDQYGTMSDDKLMRLSVQDLAADDCMFLMWATAPKMDSALRVMAAWGFQYKTVFLVWVKTTKDGTTPLLGLGHYTRSCCEMLLLGTRGSPASWRASRSLSQLLVAPRGRHSAKPAKQLRERLGVYFGTRRYEKMKKLELFARERPDGWAVHGDQVDADVTL